MYIESKLISGVDAGVKKFLRKPVLSKVGVSAAGLEMYLSFICYSPHSLLYFLERPRKGPGRPPGGPGRRPGWSPDDSRIDQNLTQNCCRIDPGNHRGPLILTQQRPLDGPWDVQETDPNLTPRWLCTPIHGMHVSHGCHP